MNLAALVFDCLSLLVLVCVCGSQTAAQYSSVGRSELYAKCLMSVFCGMVWCGMVWHGVAWCGVAWCGMVWCGMVWCGIDVEVLGEPGKCVSAGGCFVVCFFNCDVYEVFQVVPV